MGLGFGAVRRARPWTWHTHVSVARVATMLRHCALQWPQMIPREPLAVAHDGMEAAQRMVGGSCSAKGCPSSSFAGACAGRQREQQWRARFGAR